MRLASLLAEFRLLQPFSQGFYLIQMRQLWEHEMDQFCMEVSERLRLHQSFYLVKASVNMVFF
jgi:hypothetical protein